MSSLDIQKSSGPDAISSLILRSCAPKLTPVLSHLFWHSYSVSSILNSQILFYIEDYLLINGYQYSFCHGRSTGDLLVTLVHSWTAAIKSKGENLAFRLEMEFMQVGCQLSYWAQHQGYCRQFLLRLHARESWRYAVYAGCVRLS